MSKVLPLLAISIFAPSLVWMAIGGQLIYLSQVVRRRRLKTRTDRFIQAHARPAPLSPFAHGADRPVTYSSPQPRPQLSTSFGPSGWR
jgi:hypothetical protein